MKPVNQQTKNRYVAVTQQIDSVRRLYSQIGQPLPAEIIIDLHHHLGTAMQMYRSGTRSNIKKKNRIQS